MSKTKANQRAKLFEQQGGRCYYCAKPMRLVKLKPYRPPAPNTATLDHIIPTSAGGARSPSLNCVAACQACNNERGTMDARLFLLEKLGVLA